MNTANLLLSLSNKTYLLIFMALLIGVIVILVSLGIVFIIALRKRRPVVKVVMAPTNRPDQEEEPEPEPEPEPVIVEESNDGEEGATYVTEGQESIRYDRSFTAKLCQLSNESKEWYSEIKNDLLSYEKVKDRMSWKRETFRIGRMNVARLIVRGKTLCLLLAVEASGYVGTKYTVEDVSDMTNMVDTPTLYRIKSARRLKYAKEMIAGLMQEINYAKDPLYVSKDFFLPYEGDMSLIKRGLVKRVVSGSTRTFKIEEVDASESEENDEAAASDQTGDGNGENS